MILAGIAIGIGGMVYLTIITANGTLLYKIIASFLFSFGLLSVIAHQLPLVTGKAGLARGGRAYLQLLKFLCFNCVGAILAAEIFYLCDFSKVHETAVAIVKTKEAIPYLTLIFRSFMCGVLMYLAITCFTLSENYPPMAVLPVAIFILCGFEHSIADTFYFAYAYLPNAIPFAAWGRILIIALSNILGSLAISFGEQFFNPSLFQTNT